MKATSIIIATPHHRNDVTETIVRQRLPEIEVVRARSPDELASHSARPEVDWIFFPHWSWRIPPETFEAMRCVVFHMTDLPYGRGGSPLQNLILRGHKHTKLSAIQCISEIDAGPIYLKRELSLEGTAENILTRAATEIADMIIEIVRTNPTPKEQTGEITVFARRKPIESAIPETIELPQLHDFIRMLDADGYPPAFTDIGKLRLELRDAHLVGDMIEARARIKIKP